VKRKEEVEKEGKKKRERYEECEIMEKGKE